MAFKPKHPCNHPGCHKLTTERFCEDHKQKPWAKNSELKRRFKGRHLQRERKRLFEEHPLCVECLKRGLARAATRRDHIIPLAEGGEDTRENTQALCDECHDRKSRAEAIRGRGYGDLNHV